MLPLAPEWPCSFPVAVGRSRATTQWALGCPAGGGSVVAAWRCCPAPAASTRAHQEALQQRHRLLCQAQRLKQQPRCGWTASSPTWYMAWNIPMTEAGQAGREGPGWGNTWGRPQGHPCKALTAPSQKHRSLHRGEPVSNSCDAHWQPPTPPQEPFTRILRAPGEGAAVAVRRGLPRATTAPPGTHKHPLALRKPLVSVLQESTQ